MNVISIVDNVILRCRATALSNLADELTIANKTDRDIAVGLITRMRKVAHQAVSDNEHDRLVRLLMACAEDLLLEKLKESAA